MLDPQGKNLVIIIGAMKSGTTSLFKHLTQHPDIITTHKNEARFFTKHYDKGIEFYKTLWPTDNRKNVVYVEATPSYSKAHLHEGIPQKIYNNFPKARLIYILRNPIKRTESNYRQYMNDTGDRRGINTHLPEELIKSSMYFFQISKFLECFDKSQIKILKTSDVKNNPKDQLKILCDFMGVKPYDFKNLEVQYGDSKVTNSKFYQDYRKHRILQPIASLIPQKLKYNLIKLISKKEYIENDLWKLNEENYEKLKNRFSQDNDKLVQEFGINLFD